MDKILCECDCLLDAQEYDKAGQFTEFSVHVTIIS